MIIACGFTSPTFLIQNFSLHNMTQETVTADNAGQIILELSDVITEASSIGSIVDQSSDNFEIISTILSSTSSLTNSRNLTTSDVVCLT